MVIRVAFNNAGWAGKCTNVRKGDTRFFKCQNNVVRIGDGQFQLDEKGTCTSGCDEAHLCTDYRWPCHHGSVNPKRATGIAFFVFPTTAGDYTLWGYSTIEGTEGPYVYFSPFQPLPELAWLKGLTAQALVGKAWRQGTYRFIDSAKEKQLLEHIARAGH